MTTRQHRELGRALRRGAAAHCPRCGAGRVFNGYLAMQDACGQCGLGFRPYAPAAGPAFLTIAVTGMIMAPVLSVAAAILGPDRTPLVLVGIVTMPVLALVLLRVIKGAMVGYLWALRIGARPDDKD